MTTLRPYANVVGTWSRGIVASSQASVAWKGWVGYVLLAVCVVAAMQGYRTSQRHPEVEAMARALACPEGARCDRKRPRRVETGMLGQRYIWARGGRSVTVSCSRALLWVGAWRCRVEP